MEQRTAFGRAWDVLSIHSGQVWTARICAIGAGFLTAALLVVVALFVDLLISQGRIPAFAELGGPPRSAFAADLPAFDGERMAAALEAVGAPQIPIDSLEKLNSVSREQLWRAFVWDMLKSRVNQNAADTYAAAVKAADPATAVGIPGFGSLSLVVRSLDRHRVQPVLGWLASWNAWSWRPVAGSFPNYWYLTGILYLAVILALIRAALLYRMNYSASLAALAVSTRLRRAIYHHTYRLGTLTIQSPGAGPPVNLFNRQVETVADAVHERLSSQFFGPTELFFLLAFALAIHFWLALAFLLAALIVMLVGGWMASSFRRGARRADRRASARMALLQESLTMMRLVKSNVMEVFNQSRVERQLTEYADARARRIRGEAIFRPIVWFLGIASAAILLYVSGLIVMSRGLGTANVIALAAAIVCSYWPMRSWLNHRRIVRQGRDAAVLVYEFLDRPREVGQAVGADFLAGIDHGVEFRGVSLRDLQSGRVLLDNVNLEIGAGEHVGLVGLNEAEKHAFVYLLARFLDPSNGELLIDDKSLKWLTLESLRNQLGLVVQPNLVFSDTVANNIGCGDAAYSIPQIIEAAKLAHAHQFVQRLPYGYETPLGELGTSLRPGEQFRIALARAIVRDPAMYVIEEPATPLDEETKDLLDDTFDRILPGKTVLFLPHRISTIRKCERLFLIHRGKVEAVGDHKELVAANDLYKHLHYLEFNEFAEKV